MPRQAIDDSSLQFDSPTRVMIFDHLKGPSEKRFISNSSIGNAYEKSRFARQPVLVDMGKQVKTIEQLKNSQLINRHVYDIDDPKKKYSVKYPDVNPQYKYDLETIKPRTKKNLYDFSK